MHSRTLLPVLLSALPLLTSAQSSSFYDIVLYADSFCSILTSGISGSGNKTCTILPTTSNTSIAGSSPEIYMQTSFATCVIDFFSDADCAAVTAGTTSPPNLGCVGAGKARYYSAAC